MPSARLQKEITRSDDNQYRLSYWGSVRTDDPLSDVLGESRIFEEYENLLDDADIFSLFQNRTEEVLHRPLIVKPAESRDHKIRDIDRRAAEFIEYEFTRPGFNFTGMCRAMLEAIIVGFKVAEILPEKVDGWTTIKDVRVRKSQFFRFYPDPAKNETEIWGNAVRYHPQLWIPSSSNSSKGIPLPKDKFIVFSYGSNSSNPNGMGLGSKLYWLRWFADEMMKNTIIYGERFAQPLMLGFYQQGADKVTLDRVLKNLSRGRTATLPKDLYEIVLLEAQRSSSQNFYEWFFDMIYRSKARVVRGQIHGEDASQGLTGQPSKQDSTALIKIAKSDADALSHAINTYLVAPLVRFNFGRDAKPPTVWRHFPELETSESLKERADRDMVLYQQGWRLTDQEFERVYGTGYYDKEKEDKEQEPVTPQGDEMESDSDMGEDEEPKSLIDRINSIVEGDTGDGSSNDSDNEKETVSPESGEPDTEMPSMNKSNKSEDQTTEFAIARKPLNKQELLEEHEKDVERTAKKITRHHERVLKQIQDVAKNIATRNDLSDRDKLASLKNSILTLFRGMQASETEATEALANSMQISYLVSKHLQTESARRSGVE